MKIKILLFVLACVLILVSCAPVAVQEIKQEVYDNGISCVNIPMYISRCVDKTNGYVCYMADNDMECFKLGE